MSSVAHSIGVLDLQGCVDPHRPHVESTGFTFKKVKTQEDLAQVSGLIIPGGESTTLLKLIDIFGLEAPLREAFRRIPVWGICAGSILIAKEVKSPSQKSFGLIDMTIVRNAYGRQIQSFHTKIEDYPVSFIRAPRIEAVGKAVQVRAMEQNEPVWVEQGSYMATTFHAELSSGYPSPMHAHFAEKVRHRLLEQSRPKKSPEGSLS